MPELQPVHHVLRTDPSPQEAVRIAAGALRAGERPASLEQVDLPVYMTDAEGYVTFFNRACVTLAGRMPVAGQDRWCVTWRLYTEDGAFLPHDRCPMAEAIRERKAVNDVTAIAERPDGSRIRFQPHATPVADEEGRLVGAVNILLEVSDARHAESLEQQAGRCRRLASSITDLRAVATLEALAEDYESRARALKRH